MSAPQNQYPVIGFQWELLAIVVNMWTKQELGVDVLDTAGREKLKTVLDDEFCLQVVGKFEEIWTKPKVVDPDRQERLARILVELDEMVEEVFQGSEELRETFRRRCAEAGVSLEPPRERPSTVVSPVATPSPA